MDIVTRKISKEEVPPEIIALAEGLISKCDNVITISQLEGKEKEEEDAE